jgi:Uma2 family endonuclease
MATEYELSAFPPDPAVPWPPNDTEESILGTDLHQTTIRNLVLGLNGAARVSRAAGDPVPWRALTQMLLLGCRRPDGSYYRTYPDVVVYRKTIDPNRGSHTVDVDGPPVVIIEVLSETTCDVDIDPVRGKVYSYAHAGVQEYLTFDPAGLYLPEGVRAWRLRDGVYGPWKPEPDGRYRSETLPVAVALEGSIAAVYLADGRRMHQEDEVEEEIARLRRLLEER